MALHRGRGVHGGARLVSEALQQLATRRAAGLFDFSFMGLYEFGDAAALQALQSRDLGRLAPGRIAYTLLLDEHGSVRNDATVWRLDSGLWWLFTGRRADALWIAERTAARVRSGEHAVLALQGPAAGAILARLVGEDAVRSLRYFGFAARRIAGAPAWIGRIGYSGELGYEILVPAALGDAARQALLDAGAAERLGECSFEAADGLRIESGYVLFDREITGRERPEELGLARLVERRGLPRFAPSRRLVGLEIERVATGARPWLPRAQLTSEADSALFAPRLGLGFAAIEDAAPGTLVQLDDGRRARVARLPFYDPMRRRPRAMPL
jgi:glycine cleavage system aminomethyltransferase T